MPLLSAHFLAHLYHTMFTLFFRPLVRIPGTIIQFVSETYPEIAEKAENEGADIYWGDETGVTNQAYHMRGYAPKGQTPVIDTFPRVEKTNMISSVNMRGKCHYLYYEKNMTQQLFISYMEKLIEYNSRKIFFIVDNLKVHHGKMVDAWLAEHHDLIQVFFTPAYSPEINPDEYLNHILKQSVHSGEIPHTQKQIRTKTEEFMQDLQNHPERVASLFKHKKLAFIFCAQK